MSWLVSKSGVLLTGLFVGYTVSEVAEENPGFLRWARGNTTNREFKRQIDEVLTD